MVQTCNPSTEKPEAGQLEDPSHPQIQANSRPDMDTQDPFSTEKNQIVHLIICSVLYVNYA